VLRQEGFIAAQDADRVLEVAAEGEDGREFCRPRETLLKRLWIPAFAGMTMQGNRHRHIASGAAQKLAAGGR